MAPTMLVGELKPKREERSGSVPSEMTSPLESTFLILTLQSTQPHGEIIGEKDWELDFVFESYKDQGAEGDLLAMRRSWSHEQVKFLPYFVDFDAKMLRYMPTCKTVVAQKSGQNE